MEKANETLMHRVHLINEVRALSAIYAEFTYHFAVWLELHPTDALALTEILFAEDLKNPLSPARLAEKISLSSGATTAALDRLENVGYISRSRESSDRRIVTLRTTPNIRPLAIEFFAPLGEYMDRYVESHSKERIEEFKAQLTSMRLTMQDALENQKNLPPKRPQH
jgi:MarR family transcriptional regulator, organic hydroperoxide resistance regulator